jgi:hypothetical protein
MTAQTNSIRAVVKTLLQTAKNPRDFMVALIYNGTRRNTLPIDANLCFSDVKVINALLEEFKDCRYYSFEFLQPIRQELIKSMNTPADSVRFLSNVSKLGYVNHDLTVTVLTHIVESGFLEQLSAGNAVQLIDAMAKQRVRERALVSRLLDRHYTQMSPAMQARSMQSLASLSIAINEVPRVGDSGYDGRSALDIALGFCLSPDLMDSRPHVESSLIPALELLGSNKAWLQGNALNVPAIAKKLQIVRETLRCLYPRTLARSSINARQFLAEIDMPISPPRNRVPSFTSSLSDTLFAIGVRHQINVLKGPFTIDILESGNTTIWNCEDETEFYAGPDSRMKTSYYVLRERILSASGYNIINVPISHWNRCKNKKAKVDYCQMSRFLEIADNRPIRNDGGNTEYCGEYWFKKEQPKQSWTWHGHCTFPLRVSL